MKQAEACSQHPEIDSRLCAGMCRYPGGAIAQAASEFKEDWRQVTVVSGKSVR